MACAFVLKVLCGMKSENQGKARAAASMSSEEFGKTSISQQNPSQLPSESPCYFKSPSLSVSFLFCGQEPVIITVIAIIRHSASFFSHCFASHALFASSATTLKPSSPSSFASE